MCSIALLLLFILPYLQDLGGGEVGSPVAVHPKGSAPLQLHSIALNYT